MPTLLTPSVLSPRHPSKLAFFVSTPLVWWPSTPSSIFSTPLLALRFSIFPSLSMIFFLDFCPFSCIVSFDSLHDSTLRNRVLDPPPLCLTIPLLSNNSSILNIATHNSTNINSSTHKPPAHFHVHHRDEKTFSPR